MNMTLYEVANDYLQALRELDSEDLPEEAILNTLEGLKGTLEQKAMNVSAYIRNIEAEATALKHEEQAFKKRRQRLEKMVARYKNYLLINMQKCGIKQISCPHWDIKLHKGIGKTYISDPQLIPERYMRVKPEPNIEEIRKALLQGIYIPGAHLIKDPSVKISF
jgi:hypothetical protein